MWGALEMTDQEELQNIDLFDTHWKYSESVAATCDDIKDIFDLDKLFELQKEWERNIKTFNTRSAHTDRKWLDSPASCQLKPQSEYRLESWEKFFKF